MVETDSPGGGAGGAEENGSSTPGRLAVMGAGGRRENGLGMLVLPMAWAGGGDGAAAGVLGELMPSPVVAICIYSLTPSIGAGRGSGEGVISSLSAFGTRLR